MPEETMTARERWMAVLEHKIPDRIPMDYWATDEATAKIMKYLGYSNKYEMLQKLHVDYMVKAEPEYIGPSLPENQDVFGCLYRDIDYGSGKYEECIFHPLADFQTIEELESNYTWPDPDWWDYSGIPDQIRNQEIYPVQGGHYEPFLIYKYLRGDEQGYMDLMLHPEMVHYCLDKLLHLGIEDITRIYEQIPGQVLVTYVAEDMGAQDDLLISPQHIKEFLIPRMKKVMDLVHQAGAFVFHHNDGAVSRILPDLIEAGIDLLNPIQWRCQGMDRKILKSKFGNKIVFHGAMDNQETLVFGSVKDVENEVLENLDILGGDGGYILAPCHNIQAASPPANIVAMYETCFKNGFF
jgi:uroporphyrinogen decarboxylase